MRIGDKVTTPKGAGIIAAFEEHRGFRRIGVDLDVPLWHGNPAYFYPIDHVELDK